MIQTKEWARSVSRLKRTLEGRSRRFSFIGGFRLSGDTGRFKTEPAGFRRRPGARSKQTDLRENRRYCQMVRRLQVGDGVQKRERLTHVPEYHRCTRLYKPAGGCTIQHTIEIDTEPTDAVFLVDNSASMDPVIADLRNNVRTFANLMMQGKAHNLRMGGAAYRDKDYLWNNIPFSYAYSDFQHWINGVRTERAETYPFAVVRWAIDHYPWRENVHRIIVLIGNDDYGCGFDPGQSFCPSRTEIIRALQEKGIQLYIFHNNPDVRSIGIPLADYFAGPKLLKFAQFFTIVTDHWSPQSCINDARATLEPFCKGRYTPWPRDENACVTISGFDICKGDPLYQKLKAPPLPNAPRQAARVEVSALSCDYNHGQG